MILYMGKERILVFAMHMGFCVGGLGDIDGSRRALWWFSAEEDETSSF